MSYIHRCLIVPAARVELARELVVVLGGEAAMGMFTVGLSPSGHEPFTHYVSSGMIEEQFGAVLADPVLMTTLCNAAGRPIAEQACIALLSACDITDEHPFPAFERMLLSMLTTEELAARQAARDKASSQ